MIQSKAKIIADTNIQLASGSSSEVMVGNSNYLLGNQGEVLS